MEPLAFAGLDARSEAEIRHEVSEAKETTSREI